MSTLSMETDTTCTKLDSTLSIHQTSPWPVTSKFSVLDMSQVLMHIFIFLPTLSNTEFKNHSKQLECLQTGPTSYCISSEKHMSTASCRNVVLVKGIGVVTDPWIGSLFLSASALFCGSHLKPSVAGDKHYRATMTCGVMKTKPSLWSDGAARGGAELMTRVLIPCRRCVRVLGGGSIRGKTYSTAETPLPEGSGTTNIRSIFKQWHSGLDWLCTEISIESLFFFYLTFPVSTRRGDELFSFLF